MSTKAVTIALDGCNYDTCFNYEADEGFLRTLRELQRLSHWVIEYGCNPVLTVYEGALAVDGHMEFPRPTPMWAEDLEGGDE